MNRRSTNELGYTHFTGDLTAQVGSSHGVRLTGGSTGGIVEAVGDDTAVTLTLRGQGAGGVQVGAASTSPITLMQRHLIQFTIPAMSSGSADESTTVAITGCTTNAFLQVQQRVVYNSTISSGILVLARCSTAAQVRLSFINVGASTLSGSTASAYLLQIQ